MHDLKQSCRFTDLKREFFNVDVPRSKKQFGKITVDNKDIIDG